MEEEERNVCFVDQVTFANSGKDEAEVWLSPRFEHLPSFSLKVPGETARALKQGERTLAYRSGEIVPLTVAEDGTLLRA